MSISRVLETCLYVDDLDKARRFYSEVLGLEAFAEVSGRHVFFRCGDAVFLLFDPEQTERRSGEVPPHGARGPGHVAQAGYPRSELRAGASVPAGLRGVQFRFKVLERIARRRRTVARR